MIQSKIYAACLQTRGKQGASRMTAPGRPGTNPTNAGAFVTFSVPGAFVTNPTAINNLGAITGSYTDAGGVKDHSFLRTSDGTITPFDPPEATSEAVFVSFAAGINPNGTIVGFYAGTDFLVHGYLRAPNGTFTVFDPPFSVETLPTAINPDGAVTGVFFTFGSTEGHGFLRAPNGTITTFDPLGSTFTRPAAINPAGTVTGLFIDARSVWHGFLRTTDGTITEFDPVGSTQTEAVGINPAGTIVGDFSTTDGFVHGFLRAPNGAITVFDAPGSQFTLANSIDPAGNIAGSFFIAPTEPGFLRAPNGTFTVFVVGSELTNPVAINPAGTVTGGFDTFTSAVQGFVGRPKNMR